MTLSPVFPTKLHQHTAEITREYYLNIPEVDTVLITNSCARGQATPESDLDIAILVKPETHPDQICEIETRWLEYSGSQPTITGYNRSSPFAHLHLDIINGKYTAAPIEPGGQVDSFEIEIGNHICHSAPFGNEGAYFQQLRLNWLPYYSNVLRQERFEMIYQACLYDLAHIPVLMKRGLNFHAFDILYTAFQKFLQLLFISKRVYPIAYNKWIREQVIDWLKMPDLYPVLLTILSINRMESDEINLKALKLAEMLNEIKPD